MYFSSKSLKNLGTCDKELQVLFKEVIKEQDCTILEGHRSLVRQNELFVKGRTKTMKSNHLYLPSRAVDVMPYPIDWKDREGQLSFSRLVKYTACRLGIQVRWGGDFKSFYDAPHWEIIKIEKR